MKMENKDFLLQVKDVSVSYKNNKVISGVSLNIERGKIYSIIGPNGCGKTTLMRVMGRNLKPDSGDILLDGKNIFRVSSKSVARNVAVLTQNHNTTSDVSVKALVQYGRYAHQEWWRGKNTEDEEIVDWAIGRAALHGYENRKINTLSGGEQQRAWIAMSIAQKPKLLLFDEPTTYLDISHQLEIMELVSSLNREDGITIVMVLHDINHAARFSDRMAVIFGQKVYMEGEPWDVLSGNVLKDVFRVSAEVTNDTETGKPIFYAKNVIRG